MESQVNQNEPATVSDSKALEALELLIAEKRRTSDPPPAVPKTIAETKRPERTPMPPEDEAALERRIVEKEKEDRREKYEANLSKLKAAVGARYAKCSLDNYEITTDLQARVVNALREYVETGCVDRGEGIVLYGPVGTGKDHLLYAVASACIGVEFRAAWVNGQDLFGDIRDRMDSDKPEAKLLETYSGAQLLVISDPLPPFGNLSQHQATMLYRLMDDRAARRWPTFVSINVADDQEADERLGAATWDRMCDGAWKMRCSWPSHRRPVKEIK